jgi:cysteine synthase
MGDRSGGAGGGDRGDRIHYPTLTSTNYTSWAIRVQAIMQDQGAWEVIELTREQSEQVAAVAARKTKDTKAKAHLLQCLPNDQLMQMATKKTGKEVWDSLKARFVGGGVGERGAVADVEE